MRISLLTKNKKYNFDLPINPYGSYWIYDGNDKNDRIISVESNEDNWIMQSNNDVKIISNDGTMLEEMTLSPYSFYHLKNIARNREYILYCEPIYDNSFKTFSLEQNTIVIGGKTSFINYPLFSNLSEIFKVHYENGWILDFVSENHPLYATVYVNNEKPKLGKLFTGDVLFCMGLKFIFVDSKMMINNPLSKATLATIFKESPIVIEDVPLEKEDLSLDISLYEEKDYFFRSPRFQTAIEKETLKIDAPPMKHKEDETPGFLLIGPMLTMGATSATTLATTLSKIAAKEATFKDSLPSLVISFSMLLSMILWPTLKRKYDNMRKKKLEEKRQKKYSSYIKEKQEKIIYMINKQRQILNENAISLADCEKIILNQARDLWSRKIEQPDFLNLKLGMGVLPLEVDIHYPEEHFSMDDDNLKDILNRVVEQSKDVTNVPITISLVDKYIVSIVGKRNFVEKALKDLILQMITFHSYEDLKIVGFFDESKEDNFEYFKKIPHSWNDLRTVRYYATNFDEMKDISFQLFPEIARRNSQEKQNYKNSLPYYVVIVNNYKLVQNLEFIKEILEQKENKGFTLIVLNEDLTELPNECTTFINVDGKKGGVFESELISTKQKEFMVDDNPLFHFEECLQKINNIPIKFTKASYALPTMLTFLELYNVGKVEQLNALYRWKNSNPTKTLQAPVGVDEYGMPFYIDLHEKAHGPHGLIAGMTGSGKSEFIITFVLSLAINYHPHEVSFILIDYKGGGLAGAFENRQNGIRLPHLAGTITNLDTAQMNRALASIESELKRRQAIFNKTRELLNEGVIDIYKYQKLYREKKVTEPLPHLLIISDEFAELKVQQPDFMDQLISTARIGRSLGVHLILATQKPSGVVNEQIWSNSRFRICLKVQEKEDSMDMLKSPEAVTIKEKGRFYLQVGYNELFLLGQSAWSGAAYVPTNKIVKKKDNSIGFINNTGDIYAEVKEDTVQEVNAMGEQLGSIVNYLVKTAQDENIEISKLWLDPIPEFIFVNELKEKYSYQKTKSINTVIGEYDDPANQSQFLFDISLLTDGNIAVYGTADSGTEKFLQTFIYSLVTSYTSEEIHLYLVDLGSETLKVFENFPQVGGLVLNADQDRLKRLFNLLMQEIEIRKDKLSKFSGDYTLYVQSDNNDMPFIVVVINNIEGFREVYQLEEEDLVLLSREGLKYGILFVITSATSMGAGFKLTQNFRQKLVLRMNDSDEYSTILGRVGKMVPSNFKGRGLFRKDNVYEFQTASIAPVGQELEVIQNALSTMKDMKKVKMIPTLPEVVSVNMCLPVYKDMSTIPIGIEKDTLNIATYDLKKNYITLVTCLEFDWVPSFGNAFVSLIGCLKGIDFQVFDLEKTLIDTQFEYKSSYEEWALSFSKQVDELYKIYLENDYEPSSLDNISPKVYLINGIGRLKNSLSLETQKIFFEAIEKAKILDKYHFIFIDTVDKFKALEYETWYKSTVRSNQGIWIGNGITEQFSLKLNKVTKDLYEELPPKFGYYVKGGNYKLIKLVELGEEDE